MQLLEDKKLRIPENINILNVDDKVLILNNKNSIFYEISGLYKEIVVMLNQNSFSKKEIIENLSSEFYFENLKDIDDVIIELQEYEIVI